MNASVHYCFYAASMLALAWAYGARISSICGAEWEESLADSRRVVENLIRHAHLGRNGPSAPALPFVLLFYDIN